MPHYIGDYAEDYTTLNVKFSTHQYSTGAPFALASGAISVYKGSDATQSTAGITLTSPFDSVTGMHNVLIDLSADAFYATGQDYAIVITTGTVDGVSVVGSVIATFSIENRTTHPKADYPTNFSALGIESDGDLTKVNTLDGHTAQTADHTSAISTVDTVVDGIQNDLSNGTDGLGALKTLIDAVQTDLDNGTDGLGALKTLIDTVDTVVDAIAAKFTGITLVSEWLGAMAGKQAADATARAEIRATGAGSGTFDETTDSLEGSHDTQQTTAGTLATAANLATVDTVVDGIQSDLDNATDGLGALKTLVDAVQTTADAVETDTQNIQSRLPTALVSGKMDSDATAISGSTDAADKLEDSLETMHKGSCTSNGTTTTIIDTTLGSRDDTYIGRTVIMHSGTLIDEATTITDYDQASNTLTFDALTGSTTSGDEYMIV